MNTSEPTWPSDWVVNPVFDPEMPMIAPNLQDDVAAMVPALTRARQLLAATAEGAAGDETVTAIMESIKDADEAKRIASALVFDLVRFAQHKLGEDTCKWYFNNMLLGQLDVNEQRGV